MHTQLFSIMKKIIAIAMLFYGCSATAQELSDVVPFQHDDLIQFPNIRDFTISNDEGEAYFTAQSQLGELSLIMFITKKGENWSSPEIASFSGRYNDLEPFLAFDGLKLYFASNRSHDKSKELSKDYDIWFVERKDKDSQWSEPINLGAPINTEHNEFYPSVSLNENMYFTSDRPESKGKDDIYFSRQENGQYTKPRSLNDSINSNGYEFNAYISPDESFLIYSGYNREDGFGSGDIYISYRKKDGSWSNAQNLGQHVNSKFMDYCPFINASSEILYFTSRRSNLKTPLEGFNSTVDFLSAINGYENGFSRIYLVSFNSFLPSSKYDK